MTRFALVACLAAFAIPLAATAQQSPNPAPTPAPPAPKVAEAKNDPNKLICTMEKVTGSNLKRRVCKTQAQLDQEKQHADWFLEEAKRQAQTSIMIPRN
jgi:hypothetical protein